MHQLHMLLFMSLHDMLPAWPALPCRLACFLLHGHLLIWHLIPSAATTVGCGIADTGRVQTGAGSLPQ